jgi:hypothetical protein
MKQTDIEIQNALTNSYIVTIRFNSILCGLLKIPCDTSANSLPLMIIK